MVWKRRRLKFPPSLLELLPMLLVEHRAAPPWRAETFPYPQTIRSDFKQNSLTRRLYKFNLFWQVGYVFAAFVNWWAWGWYNAMVEKLLWSSWSSQDIYYKIKCQADEEEEQRDSTRRKNPPVKAFWLFISFLFYFGLILCLSVFVFILYFDILIVPMNLCKK